MYALCTNDYAYDAEDASNLAFAIRMTKIELGKAAQAVGLMTNVTYANSDQPHAEYAGELAATALNLTQRQLADARTTDIAGWVDDLLVGQPLLVRINALLADLGAARVQKAS